MMTGQEIGRLIKSVCDETNNYAVIRHEGNLGMALIAAAIADHADAMRGLASALILSQNRTVHSEGEASPRSNYETPTDIRTGDKP